jgi:hypothetical protein
VITRVMPLPVVGRRALVVTYDVMHPGSVKARFQSLRKAGVVSTGISRPRRRRHGRVDGTLRLYSELNREAVRVHRRGNSKMARSIAAEATRLERQPDLQQLVGMLAALDNPLDFDTELRSADIERLLSNREIAELIRSAAISLESIQQSFQSIAQAMESIGGVVSGIRDSIAVIETVRGAFTFPIAQLSHLNLDHVGAAVQLQWETFQAAGTWMSVAAGIPLLATTHDLPLSPFAYTGPPMLPEARWAQLRRLGGNARIELPPLPIPLPGS